MEVKSIQFKKQQLLVIFVLTLVVSVALGTTFPVSTQIPLTVTCEKLKFDIQNRAKRDAKADRLNFFNTDKKKKTTGDISTLYKEANSKNLCFRQDVLWDIYEKEYDAHKYPSWMPALLLFLLGSVFWAALSDTLKKWVNKSLEAIGNWVYKQFAGTPLFENIALKKYQQALIKKYQKLNIPFRPNRPLEMREVYVSLKVAEDDRSLIEAENAIQKYRRLMVKGDPGSGKSMLLKYLALSYAEGRLRNLSDRPVPILLELSRLNEANLTVEKLEQQLFEVCDRNNFPKANRFVSQSLKDGHLMLLLDGLDEPSSSVRPHVVQCLKDFLDKYEKCWAIITCRTAVYNNEFVDVINQTLEIEKFSDQQIRHFLQAWKLQMPVNKSVEQLIQTLRDRPKIMALARNPLLLTIITYLYTDTSFVLPHSRAEFYTKATDILLEFRDQERNILNQYSGVNKRRVLQHLALYAQDSANRQQQDRRSLSDQEVLEQVKQVLPSLNIEPKEANSIVDEIVNRSGLLLRIDGGQRYQFAHLTLQEYFVAAALRDRQNELIQRWKEAPSDWREIVKLWCGLANNSTTLIEAVYKCDRLTAFDCLADAQEVEQKVAQQIIDNFKTQLGQEENDEIISTFGSVAADMRPRGRDLFEFLAEKLANRESLAGIKVAAQALSMTNLSQAAERLAQFYHDVTVREALIRMGDLAVPKLKLLAEQGNSSALEDLKTIATPEAAITLVAFLWNTDISFSSSAAWHLGELLCQPEMEEILGKYSLTPAQKQAEFLDWIWQPFGEFKASALPVIAGRIAYLLVKTFNLEISLPFMPSAVPKIDSRLMVPICSIAGVDQIQLPSKWNSQAEALLKQQSLDENLEQQLREQVEKVLGVKNINTRWRLFLFSLAPRLQLDLLRRLIHSRHGFTINNWRNIFVEIEYEFKKSLEYLVVLIVVFLLSLGSVFEIFSIMLNGSENWLNILMALAIIVVLFFLRVLWLEVKTEEEKLEPTLLLKLGILGLWTFCREWARLLRKNLVWQGVTNLYLAEAMTEGLSAVVAVTGVVITFLATAGATTGTLSAAATVAMTGALAVVAVMTATTTTALTLAMATTGALALAAAGATTGTLSAAAAVALALATAAGFGWGIWYRAENGEDLGLMMRFLSILAFPWFCWFPIVFVFTSFAMYERLSEGWQPIISLFWLIVFGFCAFLWKRGQKLEEKARNPFRGILD